MPKETRHKVAVVLLNGAIASDFSSPIDIFSNATGINGEPCYEVKVCGVTKTVKTQHFSVSAPYSLRSLATADTIILPGIENISSDIPNTLIAALQKAHTKGIRIASVCTGAFILAKTGLLDGLSATTHWLAARELASFYPNIHVDPNVLFIDNGKVLTSAGASAAIDLCLHLIRKDFGAAVAAQSARKSVMQLTRPGGQAQFIQYESDAIASGSLDHLLIWIENNLNKQLDVPILADKAAMSVRTLHRKFAEQTGTTPNSWILQMRIRSAQQLIETTGLSIEQLASKVGFGSTANFRSKFRSIVGISPSEYKKAFSEGSLQNLA